MVDKQVTLYSIPGYDSGAFPELVDTTTIGSAKTQIPTDAVLVSLLNPRIPRVGIAREGSFCSTEFAVVEPSDFVSLNFLYRLLQSQVFSVFLTSRSKGTTGSRKRSSRDDVLRFPASLPPLHEQQRIVDLMDSVDAAISAAQAEVDTTVGLRNRMLEYELENPGEDWEQCALTDIADVVMGQSPPGSSYNSNGSGVPFIQGSAEFGATNPTPVKWCTDPRKIAEPGDVLFSVRAPVGDLNVANKQIAIGRGLSIIRGVEGKATTTYLALALTFGANEIAKRSSTGMFTSITGAQLKSLPISLPPSNEQLRIVDTMTTLDTMVSTAQTALDRLRQLRSSLLTVLLSGEHEIPESYDQFLTDTAAAKTG